MTAAETSLGALIDNARRDKHITAKRLVEDCGIAMTTYHRFIKDETDLKLPVVLDMVDFLRLEIADLTPVLNANWIHFEEVLDLIEQALLKNSAEERWRTLGEIKIAYLSKAVGKVPQSAAQQLDTMVTALMLIDKNAIADASDLVHNLVAELLSYSGWTIFEYRLVTPILSLLSFATVTELYLKFVAPLNTRQHPIDVTLMRTLDRFYAALLVCALKTHDAEAVMTVTNWFNRRPEASRRLLSTRFVHLIQQALNQEASDVAAEFEHWRSAVRRVTAASTLDAELVSMWHALEDLEKTKKGDPVKVPEANVWATPATFVPNEWLLQIRKHKNVSTTELYQGIFVSRAVFFRQFGTVERLKVSTFLKSMASLRVSCPDLSAFQIYAPTSPVGIRERIMTQMQTHLRTGKEEGNIALEWPTTEDKVGIELLVAWIDVFEAEHQDAPEQAREAAHKLLRLALGLDAWSAFENSLVISILPYIAFDQADFLFRRYVQVARYRAVHLPVADEHDIAGLYLGLFASACNSLDPKKIKTAGLWITERAFNVDNLEMSLFRAFVTAFNQDDRDAAIQQLYDDVATLGIDAEGALVQYLDALKEVTNEKRVNQPWLSLYLRLWDTRPEYWVTPVALKD